MRINRVFRVISLVLVIVPIIMLLLFNVILTGSSDSFYSTNYIAFAVIEILNIVFAILIFASKDKVRKPLKETKIEFTRNIYSICSCHIPGSRILHRAYICTGRTGQLPYGTWII